jgi:hypothetical protein
MSQQNMARVRLHCDRCGESVGICVRIRRGVPDFLRCQHDSHGGVQKDGNGELTCESCGCPWRLGSADLSGRVEDALSSNMAEWKRQGAVVLRCG